MSGLKLKQPGNCFISWKEFTHFLESCQTLLRVNPEESRPQPSGDLVNGPLQAHDSVQFSAHATATMISRLAASSLVNPNEHVEGLRSSRISFEASAAMMPIACC
jgi:hypothetical protein